MDSYVSPVLYPGRLLHVSAIVPESPVFVTVSHSSPRIVSHFTEPRHKPPGLTVPSDRWRVTWTTDSVTPSLRSTDTSDSFIHVAALSPPSPRPSSRPLSHFRSLSSVPTATLSTTSPDSKPRAPTKSTSTSQLPFVNRSGSLDFGDEMSTLPDPRSRSPAEEYNQPSPGHSQHPDLSQEVATLSTKLINAINHQTSLDDTLSATRHELDSAHDRIRELEVQNASQRNMMAGDVWVRRSTLDAERKAMHAEKRSLQAVVTEETEKRMGTEMEKNKIEQELENLTTALFEEANHMVIQAKEDAKADYEALQRKNDQLKAQLADSEGLLKSQQEQLSELKQVMETIMSEHDDVASGTAPSSPGFAKFEAREDDQSLPNGFVASPNMDSLSPAHPTSFHHILHPVLRTDLSAYDDFVALARVSKQRAGSRVSSGSMGGLNALTMGLGGSTSSAHPSNASTTSLGTSTAPSNSAPQSPNTPASAASSNSTPGAAPTPNLKDTRFFKRVQAEDVDPTLRLDTAPGLSWLARRTVQNAMADGSLVVEPVHTHSSLVAIARPQYYPCSLCGETRKDQGYLRYHRFRTSEADSAQRYPLCKYCLGRVRSTCDFLGFLRMVKDGHWRADDEDHEKAAWEESVRLREQMFWSRIGGGVIPVGQAAQPEGDRSQRPSHEQSRLSEEVKADEIIPKDVTVSANDGPTDRSTDAPTPEPTTPAVVEAPRTPPAKTDGPNSVRNSTQSLNTNHSSGSETTTRLSINIPFSAY